MTTRLLARLLAATNDKAIESLDKQLESVQKQAEVVDPDDKARKLDLQSQKVELEKRKLKLQPPKEKEKAMTIKRVVARLQETAATLSDDQMAEVERFLERLRIIGVKVSPKFTVLSERWLGVSVISPDQGLNLSLKFEANTAKGTYTARGYVKSVPVGKDEPPLYTGQDYKEMRSAVKTYLRSKRRPRK